MGEVADSAWVIGPDLYVESGGDHVIISHGLPGARVALVSIAIDNDAMDILAQWWAKQKPPEDIPAPGQTPAR